MDLLRGWSQSGEPDGTSRNRRGPSDRLGGSFKEGRWSGAYYLAGYAVECGLKACVLARVEREGVIFKDRKFLEKCWTHDIDALVKAADLETTRGLGNAANPRLAANWEIVVEWNEAARYEQWTEEEARKLYESVTDADNGVLPWLRTYW